VDRRPYVAIEYRWAEGRTERFAEIANEFVRLKVDVIVTSSTPAVIATGRQRHGLSIQSTDIADRIRDSGGPDRHRPRCEPRTREVVPGLRRLAIVANFGNPASALESGEVQTAARALGLEVITVEIRRAEDITPAFEAIEGRADAVYVPTEPLVLTNRVRINTMALGARLATIYSGREYVESAGLMSYGPNRPDLFRRAGDIADKILRGAKAADIPVEQPTKFDLVINLTTAKALRLTIPESFLLRADEVIE
jgi:putative tryptophan/tyrosine transport system substrate-binding protein